MTINQFIDQVANGEAADAKSTLNDLLSARAFEALDAKKIEIGKTLFGGREEQVEVQDTEETE